MPVISYNLPLGSQPILGTRDRFIAWLEEYAGPVTMPSIQYNDSMFGCDLLVKEYETIIGIDWISGKYIDSMIIVRADAWSIWQVTARIYVKNSPAPVSLVYQYAVYIADETLALQFKLACL